VVGTLKPFIDSTYRTLSDRMHTITAGSSAGATVAFMLVWDHPHVFAKAICMSAAFMAPRGSPAEWTCVPKVDPSQAKKKAIFLYIDNGGFGVDVVLQPGIDAMLHALKANGYKDGEDFVFFRDMSGRHSEADWAKRFPDALMLALEKGT